MIEAKQKSLLFLFLSASFLIYATVFWHNKNHENPWERTISWDVAGYYMYLPAIFIYGDLKGLGFYEEIQEQYQVTPYFDQASLHENGNYVLKYSIGQAIAMSPGFLIGHLYASGSDYPADGYSLPYHAGIRIWGLIIALIGIFLCYTLISIYFNKIWAGVGVVLLVFGTNYLEYAGPNNAMSHNYLFTITCAIVLSTIKFYKNPQQRFALIIGLLVGFAVIIRPTEIILFLIPIFWGLEDKQSISNRLRFLVSNTTYLVSSIGVFLLIVSIQLGYWKYVSGDLLVYSYGEQGFDFLKPNIYKGLFSTKSGWFLYSPLMILVIPGLILGIIKAKPNAKFLAFYLFLIVYITYSWRIWGYGGSLGARALVQSYPLFILLVLFAYEQLWTKSLWRYILIVFSGFALYINVWWVYQAHRGEFFHPDYMNTRYYTKVVGRFNVPENTLKLLDLSVIPDHVPDNIRLIDSLIFKDTVDVNGSCADIFYVSSTGYCFSKDREFSEKWVFDVADMEVKWIRVSLDLSVGHKNWDYAKTPNFVAIAENGSEIVKYEYLRIFRYFNWLERKELEIDLKVSGQEFDKISVYLWSPAQMDPIVVHGIRIYAY